MYSAFSEKMNNEVTQWFNMVQAKCEDGDLDPLVMVVEWNENGLLQRGISKNTIITRICDNYPTSVRQFLPTHSATPAIAPTLSESLFCVDGRVYLVSATRANVANILEIHNVFSFD
nr:8988_t:CDS:2 [Entrophospora candida]